MIELTEVRKSFGSADVLKGISLRFEDGSVTAVIGPSGSGKSTLLRCINLLEVPTSGTVQVGPESLRFVPGRTVRPRAVRALRRQTGMVFQNFQLFPHRTAIENVMEGLVVVLGWPRDRARDRALELLQRVGLADKAEAWPATLSGGQQQRVAIARALAPSPRVLLCDEPTSALDPELAVEVVGVLTDLAEAGTTMVMATHDLRLAFRTAQRVAVLDAGTVVETGPAREIFEQPGHERTRRFLQSLSAGAGHGVADPDRP